MAKKKKLEIDTKTLKQFERQVSIYQKNVAKGKERKSEAFENLIKDINKFYKKRGKGIAKTRTKTIAQKVRLNSMLSNFKKSSLATSKKRKERGQKTREKLIENYGKKTTTKAIDIFSTEAYHFLKDNALFDSEQVILLSKEYEDIDSDILQKVINEIKNQLENEVPEELKKEIKEDDLYSEIEKMIRDIQTMNVYKENMDKDLYNEVEKVLKKSRY